MKLDAFSSNWNVAHTHWTWKCFFLASLYNLFVHSPFASLTLPFIFLLHVIISAVYLWNTLRSITADPLSKSTQKMKCTRACMKYRKFCFTFPSSLCRLCCIKIFFHFRVFFSMHFNHYIYTVCYLYCFIFSMLSYFWSTHANSTHTWLFVEIYDKRCVNESQKGVRECHYFPEVRRKSFHLYAL